MPACGLPLPSLRAAIQHFVTFMLNIYLFNSVVLCMCVCVCVCFCVIFVCFVLTFCVFPVSFHTIKLNELMNVILKTIKYGNPNINAPYFCSFFFCCFFFLILTLSLFYLYPFDRVLQCAVNLYAASSFATVFGVERLFRVRQTVRLLSICPSSPIYRVQTCHCLIAYSSAYC